jgi:DNA-binding CsgD family transcriptional regulator
MLRLLPDESENALRRLKLTPRGREVFHLILEGISDREIGGRLGMSYSGVRGHKEKMLLANGCGTILEFVAIYHVIGLNTARRRSLLLLLRNLLQTMREKEASRRQSQRCSQTPGKNALAE